MRRRLALLLIVIVGILLALAAGIRLRGFRANSTPSAAESLLARTVRDFAIPSEAHRAANPYQQDALTVERGRDAYRQACAGCHGVDLRGETAIGQSIYPRVPNLRSARTQSLTDGDLHYIIENGVQLSGMPALARPHSEGAAWELVSYLRTTGEHAPGDTVASADAHYIGSANCQRCHAEIYARWQQTTMANVVRDPKTHPDAILPDLSTNKVAPFTREQVAFVYGSRWKQRYFTHVGDDYYPLPVQWDIGNKKWLPYHVPDKGGDWWAAFYPTDNMQRPTSATCDGCHSVDFNLQTKKVAEWNVGCERCHGPGSDHAAHPTRANIQNPGAMDDVSANDTCISCHSQGRPRAGLIDGKAVDWPVGYKPGLKLADFWKLEDTTLGQTDFLHFADGTAHKNRMQGNDFVQSTMYRHGVTCSSCHDPHGSANAAQLRKPADKICLDCHAAGSANGPHTATLEDHTHHKAGSAGSQCVACHMPKIETEGVPGAFVSAHTFRFITPGMTDQYKMPNPCTTCHQEKTTAWAGDALRKWTSTSPWRVAD
ncbi:cytochrome c3 family protein [Terriglobus roseus]|uniref:Doubled CXXCH domain-containing protein n=1 Tax=Terriglobus roseus TaxID=392734 RepID=A0A1H4QSN1_9BACT|nr:cytochrome c3 family protein [Terriglobus roseus]SEC22518.1 doubled CXXCH domain-containing protein [Terriglobus roseus]